jgi:methionyl-tRNA synthetase
MAAADMANEFIAKTAPWSLAKDPSLQETLKIVLFAGINIFRDLAITLRPILPDVWKRAAAFLSEPQVDIGFEQIGRYATNRKLKPFAMLLTRIDPKQIEAMIEASKESMEAAPQPAIIGKAETPASPSPEPAASSSGSISIDDFARLDLRIGTVLECGFIDGSDKLLRFLLDAGDLGQRQIFSGIRAAYAEPEKLIGRKVVFIANLAPRKMRFGVSEGMILSAGGDDGKLFLLDVDAGAQPGMPVK